MGRREFHEDSLTIHVRAVPSGRGEVPILKKGLSVATSFQKQEDGSLIGTGPGAGHGDGADPAGMGWGGQSPGIFLLTPTTPCKERKPADGPGRCASSGHLQKLSRSLGMGSLKSCHSEGDRLTVRGLRKGHEVKQEI
jgi:hypothetical protein